MNGMTGGCFLSLLRMFSLLLKDLNSFILVLRKATCQLVQCGKMCVIISYVPQVSSHQLRCSYHGKFTYCTSRLSRCDQYFYFQSDVKGRLQIQYTLTVTNIYLYRKWTGYMATTCTNSKLALFYLIVRQ